MPQRTNQRLAQVLRVQHYYETVAEQVQLAAPPSKPPRHGEVGRPIKQMRPESGRQAGSAPTKNVTMRKKLRHPAPE